MNLFSIWLTDLNFFNVTQRIQLLKKKSWRKEFNFFHEYDAKNWNLFWMTQRFLTIFERNSKIWTFFQCASKNWTFLFVILTQRFFPPKKRRKELNLFVIWLKRIEPFFLNMTLRIEPFFSTWLIELEPFFSTSLKELIHLVLIWLKELNPFLTNSWLKVLTCPFWKLYYDSKNWTSLKNLWLEEVNLSMTLGIDFFNSIWIKELTSFSKISLKLLTLF